jgi:peptide chain release factor 2
VDAQKVMRERTQLETAIARSRKLEGDLDDAVTLAELADEEGDESSIDEARRMIADVAARVKQAELESLLSGEADPNDCYLEIHAGQGGTEAQDWAEMLARMYSRWAEKKGYKVEYLEESAGEGAGIKSVTFRITGLNAYGWLKTESGVHRLVRISPYDSNARRHHQLRLRLGLSGDRRDDQHRDRRKGLPDRYLSVLRRRRSARQQDR